MSMLFIFLVITLLVSAVSYYLMRIAKPLGLIAHPGGHRKHDHATPLVGGIAIVIGLFFGVFVFTNDVVNLLPSLALLCVVGVIDDRYKLPSWSRFLAQALAILLMVKLTGVQLTSLGFLVSNNELYLDGWSVPLTIFASIGVINAINMSDGMDGLAGSLLILVLVVLSLSTNQHSELLLVSIASIAGFLVWNFRLFRQRASIFMGDAGSTALGLLMAFLLISLTQQPTRELPPVSALWFMALPLFDAVTVLVLRPLRGQSPFAADRIHYHHLFERSGLSVNLRLLCILFIQAVFITVGYLMLKNDIAEYYQFYIVIEQIHKSHEMCHLCEGPLQNQHPSQKCLPCLK